jgi:hypothetical protein
MQTLNQEIRKSSITIAANMSDTLTYGHKKSLHAEAKPYL